MSDNTEDTSNTATKPGWTVEGAIETLLAAPAAPGADTVFAPNPQTLQSAREFLESQYTAEEISSMLHLGFEQRTLKGG